MNPFLDQPVLSNKGKVSCSRKQLEPFADPQLTDYELDALATTSHRSSSGFSMQNFC